MRDRIVSFLFLSAIVVIILAMVFPLDDLPDKLNADINASKAQVRGAAALERIADILEGKK